MRQKPQFPACFTQDPLPQQTHRGPYEPVTIGPFTRPKRSQSAWILTAWLCLLIQSYAAGVQAQHYVLNRMALEPNAMVNGMNDVGMVIGFHGTADLSVGNPHRGFIYDHGGMIGTPQTVHSLDEYIPTLPVGYIGSSCVGINNNFEVVGYFHDSAGGRIGYFYNLIHHVGGLLPKPTWSAYSYGIRINDFGDVLVTSQNTLSQPTVFQGDIVNIRTNAVRSLVGVKYVQDLNNSGQVTATLMDGSPVLFNETGTPSPIPFIGSALNNSGVAAVTYTVLGAKNRVESRVGRLPFGGTLEPIATFNSNAKDINDDGDVLANVPSAPANAFYTNGSWTYINDAVTGAADNSEWLFWTNPNTKSKIVSAISNRIGGACWMAGYANYSGTTGKGKTAVTSETRYYLLIPTSP